MPNPLRYTEEELVKELVLLEKHLKQEPYMDENFCIDCIEKHLYSIEGLAEEGIGFADSKEKEQAFVDIANTANTMKRLMKTSPDYVELSRSVRLMRKKINTCPACSIIHAKNPIPPKSLNSSYPNKINTDLIFDDKGGIQMPDWKELGIVNAGQFAGNGVRLLSDYVDEKMEKTTVEWYKKPSTYIDIAGGLALQLLAIFAIKNEDLKTAAIVVGSNMLAFRTIDVVKKATATGTGLSARPTARLSAPLRVTPVMRQGMPMAGAQSLVVVD